MGTPSDTEAKWKSRLEKLLKGAKSIESLDSRTADGIVSHPLHQQQAGPRADRARHAPWGVIQRVDHAKGDAANKQALEDLRGGATGLAITSGGTATALSHGLMRAQEIPTVLDGVMLHAISLRLEGGDDLARAFAAYVAKQPVDPARLAVTFDCKDMSFCGQLKAQGFAGPFVMADGRPAHMQGATDAQELAYVLTTIAAALRASKNSAAVSATLAATQDMFPTLAKFRALRLLWARLLEASGIAHQALQVHGETSSRMMAKLDPHSNILRSTAAVFGAGLGGADSITVLPFSILQGLPNGFARRVARNTQLVLLEESNLWRVADAASGAGYIEHLTDGLCQRAWDLFRESERSGGKLVFDPDNPACKPVIGVEAYRLEKEMEAAVEPAS